MFSKSFVALAASIAAVDAATKGFNYGSTDTNGNALSQSQFEALMNRANSLQGTSGFNSARLYTMIQADTTNDVIQAIPAAISTKTSLLLGMWASGGQDSFTNEIAALKSAISQYPGLASQVIGLSVGSEDLYRDSVTGIKNNDGVGVGPETIVNYIQQVKSALSGTALSSVAIGHVDTWDAWTNGSNSDVISNVDWLGVDSYPYFETTVANAIGAPAKKAFFDSYDATKGAAGGKPVWVTETGWPVSGPNSGAAVASTQNAETYWQDVGCEILGDINTWWYTLQDAMPTTPSPSFGIIGSDLSSAPLYDLTCKASNTTDTTSVSSSATSKKSQPTTTAIGGAGGKGGNKGQSTTTSGMVTSSALSSVSGKPTLSLNSTSIIRPTGTGSSGIPSASSNGTVPVSASSPPSTGTTGPTPSVSPTQPSVNGAAKAGSAAGAAILAIFGLVAAI